jgi:hypothetical protein
LAVAAEPVRRLKDIPCLVVKMDLKLAAGVGFASPLIQLGLFIKEIHLAGAAVLEKADDSLGRLARSLGSEKAGGGQ